MMFRQDVGYLKLHAVPEWHHLDKLILIQFNGVLGKIVNLELELVRKDCFNPRLSVLKNI